MKKIILLATFVFLNSYNMQAQVIASENFENTDEYDLPENWSAPYDSVWGFYYTAADAYYGGCGDAQALYTNLFEPSSILDVKTPNYTDLNAGGKKVSYQLRVFDYDYEVPVDYDFGAIMFSYSKDNGVSWELLGSVDSSNFTPIVDCQIVSYTIPASDFTVLGSLKFKWESTYSGVGDYDILIDNFVLEEYDDPTASIKDLDKSKLKVYPNPVSDFLTIEYDLPITNIMISDLLGRNVKEIKNLNTVDVTELSKGTYLLNIKAEDNSQSTIKFVKK